QLGCLRHFQIFVYEHALRRFTFPEARIQRRVVDKSCPCADEDGILLRAPFMYQLLTRRTRDPFLTIRLGSKIAVFCCCPFKNHIGALLRDTRKKTAVSKSTFLLQYPYFHIYAGVTEDLNSLAIYFVEAIQAAYDHLLHRKGS